MKEKQAASKQIDLPPTEYRADIPNKREPIFGPGAWEFFGQWIGYGLMALAIHWFLKR